MIFFRERDVDVELVADAVTRYLILESGDERAGTELQVVALRRAAVKRHAVDGALVVDIRDIAVRCGAVGDLDHSRVAVSDSLDLRVYLGGIHFLDLAGHGDADVILDFHVGLRVERRGESHAVFIYRFDVERGAADDRLLESLDRFLVSVGKDLVNGVLVEDLAAVHLFDDGAGSLALAEAGDGDVAGRFSEYFRHRFVERRSVGVKGYLVLIGSELFCLDQTHSLFPPDMYFCAIVVILSSF